MKNEAARKYNNYGLLSGILSLFSFCIFAILWVLLWSSGGASAWAAYSFIGDIISYISLALGILNVILGFVGYSKGDKNWGRNTIVWGIIFTILGSITVFLWEPLFFGL
ncbi:MAG: hypothetical protein ACTSUV_03280 [Candidatus Ranarchaeia archaeon]